MVTSNGKFGKRPIIIISSLIMMIGLIMLPTPEGLSVAGHRTLAIMAFVVIMWITEAIPAGVSAITLIAMFIFFLGFAPAQGVSGAPLGTVKAIPLALSGFTSSGWTFVATGMFMATAITSTGFEKRLAYLILRMVGTRIKEIIAGFMLVTYLLTFIIPSVTARAAALVPIALGLNTAFGLPLNSNINKALLLCAGMLPSCTGAGILSGSALNPVIVTMLVNVGQPNLGWLDWFIYMFPYTAVIGIIFYFLVTRMHKFEFDELPGGKEYLNKYIADLGPISSREKKIIIIMALTILLWGTDKIHGIDAASVSVLTVLAMICPYIGVSTWNELSKKVDWTSILLFGAGLSMATLVTNTGAASWLAKMTLVQFGVGTLPVPLMSLIIFLFVFIFRFGFASITSCFTTIIPAILGFLTALQNPSIPITGVVLAVVLLGGATNILPVNSSSGIVAYSTGAFETKDMVKIGIPVTIAVFVLIMVFMFTYWPLVGLWK
jgi:sodium-dependent dicarboxylate transporter 2/3/5